LVIYYQSDAFNLKCIIASKDGNRYCVREREKLELAANLLAEVTKRMKDMVAYMKSTHPDDPRTIRLVEGFNPKKVSETLPTSELTAYREREKLELAANLLAEVTKRMKDMVAYMKSTHPDDPRTIRLVEGFNPKKVSETLPTSELTAYSENKGEKVAFCLNTSKDGNKLIDLNTLTFVALHELSHIMTVSIGHKQEFWQNFKYLLQNAKEAGIYNPVDYKKNPKQYCGMSINDNPYYDLV
jgi:uncharacterized short protein YbdD (DUF466 family)